MCLYFINWFDLYNGKGSWDFSFTQFWEEEMGEMVKFHLKKTSQRL
jgi:hypothetical protein